MLRTHLFLLVLFVLALSVPGSAASFEVSTVDGLRFEAGLASQAIQPTKYLSLIFGAGQTQVGGAEQDTKHFSEGVPYAFLPMPDGSVWVLDSINKALKRFSPDGKVMAELNLGLVVPNGECVIRDFALAPADGFYFLSASDWKNLHTDKDGKIVSEIEGVTDARSIGQDPKGNVLIEIPVMQALLRFNPAGEIVEKFDFPQSDLFEAAVYTDLDGNPFYVKGNESSLELGKFVAASPTEELVLATFPLDLPPDRKAHYVSGKVLGVDAARNIYVELIAVDDDGVIHRHRVCKVSPEGKVTAQSDIRVIPFQSPDLPRHAAVMPDGRILGFYLKDKSYVLCTWTIK
ncbi:hypothetical protein AUK22_00410 [bacterium CG2_30_54_10]|nr:MAG: hypothetical protein AUK22_00410 [bacterium CG2_30_54_10]